LSHSKPFLDVEGHRGVFRPLDYKLIQSRNLGGRFEDVAVVVCHQEIAVGDLYGSHILTDENVYSEVILPEVSNLEPVQVVRPPQGVDYVLADDNPPPMARMSLLILGRLTLFLRWHHFLPPYLGSLAAMAYSGRGPASG
jgi:hypothetical protein